MDYDEDMLVELIACGEVSQTQIAERLGLSRQTVWRIANGQSRPDLQQKIADTVEGFRQETIRMAAKWLKPLLAKQIRVALEGDGETSRKCREFLLSRILGFPLKEAARLTKLAEPAKPAEDSSPDPDRKLDGIALYNSLVELSPDLKDQVVKELGGPADERLSTTESTEDTEVEMATTTATDERLSTTESTEDTEVEMATTTATDDPVSDRKGKEVADPFANFVDGPHGKKVYAASIRAIEEAKEAEKAKPPRRRVPRSPR